MALNTSKLLDRYYAGMLRPLRQSLVFPSLCNRNFQADFVGGAYDLEVPNALTDVDATEVARNADWTAASDIDINMTTISITKQSMMANTVPYLDQHQSPVSLIDRVRSIHTRGFASRIDKTVAATIVDGVPAGNVTTQAHNNQPYLTANGSWAAARSQDNSNAKTSAIMQNLYDFIAGYGVDASAGGWDADSDSPLAVWCIMAPQIARQFAAWLKSEGLSTNEMDQLVREGRMTGLSGRAFARIDGVTLMRSPRVPTVAGVRATTPPYYQVIIGTRAGASFASLPPLRQLFSPAQNQTDKPGWLLRATWFYDAWVLYSDTFALMRIPSGVVPS